MRMHFSFNLYGRMLRLALAETDGGKHMARLAVFVVIPLVAMIHALFYLLDNLMPSLWRAKIEKPIFIIGQARSGTTLFHRLMLADQGRYSFLRAWEMAFPSLIEKTLIRALGTFDERFLGSALHKKLIATEDVKLAKTRDVHDTGLFAPEEDDFCQAFSCTSGFWIVFFPYMDKLDFYYWDEKWTRRRRRRAMRGYHDTLRRQMALNGAGLVHLSKNPTFNGRVESLIEEFPDARFIVCVRDPREAIPSLMKMMKQGWRGMGWGNDKMNASIDQLIEQSFHTYRHPREVFARHPETVWMEVDYRELTSDPRSALAKVYTNLGMKMGSTLVTALDAAERKRGTHKTRHTYDLEEFGLSDEQIRSELPELFAEYAWSANEIPSRR
jgi:hypothetical protein